MDKNSYYMRPLEEGDARAILQWRYESPYDFYNPPADNEQNYYVMQFLDPDLMFHAVVDTSDNLIGFCSYGVDGQVFGGNYKTQALDIGLGMRPDLTGQGRGHAFFRTILQYGQTLPSTRFRLTVASFNTRAIWLYRRFGFEEVEHFIDAFFAVPYTVMIREFLV